MLPLLIVPVVQANVIKWVSSSPTRFKNAQHLEIGTRVAEKCVLVCVKSLRVMIYNIFKFNLFEGGAIHFLSSPHGASIGFRDGRVSSD